MLILSESMKQPSFNIILRWQAVVRKSSLRPSVVDIYLAICTLFTRVKVGTQVSAVSVTVATVQFSSGYCSQSEVVIWSRDLVWTNHSSPAARDGVGLGLVAGQTRAHRVT